MKNKKVNEICLKNRIGNDIVAMKAIYIHSFQEINGIANAVLTCMPCFYTNVSGINYINQSPFFYNSVYLIVNFTFKKKLHHDKSSNL